MRAAIIAFIVILNFILQSTLFSYIEIFGVVPNTAILIIVSYAMLRGDVAGALVGLLAGFLPDIIFGQVIGFQALLCSVTGFLCGKPFKDFVRENYLLPLILVFFVMLCYETLYYAGHFLLQGNLDYAYYFRRIILPETIYTITLCVPFYILLYRINGWLEDREKKKQSMF